MNKFKKILLGTLSVLTLGLFVATGAKVNAATYSNDNRTCTWSNDARNGILVQTSTPSSGIDYSKEFDTMPAGQVKLQRKIMLVPVPSLAAEGSVSFTADGDNSSRFLYLLTYDSTNQTPVYSTSNTKVGYTKEVKTINFTTDNVIPRDNKYYVGLATTDDYKIAGENISVTLNKDCGVTYTPVVTKCTIKFNLNGGTYEADTSIPDMTNIDSGSTIDLPDATKMSKANATFAGWKNLAGTTIAADEETYEVTASTTLIALYTYGTMPKGTYVIDPANISDIALANGFNVLNPDKVLVDSSTIKLDSNGSKTKNNISIKIPANTTADVTIAGKGGSTSNTSSYKIEYDTATTISFPEKDVTTVLTNNFTFANNSSEDKTIYIYRANNTVRLTYISVEIRDNSSYDTVELKLLKQFDDDDNPTMLRLMGEIKGVAFADFANISSVLISFNFNGNSYSQYCYKLYKSVATVDSTLTGGTNTMYTVLTISGVDAYVGKSKKFTNIKMTVNYKDGMTRTIQRSDIAVA